MNIQLTQKNETNLKRSIEAYYPGPRDGTQGDFAGLWKKQTQFPTFSIQKQWLFKKQSQIKPKFLYAVRYPPYAVLQNEPKCQMSST